MTKANKSISKIHEEILNRISPNKNEIKKIEDLIKTFLKEIEKASKELGYENESFVGGSFAKRTFLRRPNDKYDIDVFIRFDKKYRNENISEYLEGIIKKIKSIKHYDKIHGSRDYYKINFDDTHNFYLEIIPVIKVKNPREALNITDLSYSHVRYVKNKIKDEKLLNDIKLAKQFAYSCKCYGAESYIKGFSGYGLELMVYYYGGFLNFIKTMSKINFKEKIIIDIEKHHKTKNNVMMNINTSKLISPIVLVDPVFKERNVLAALSEETLSRFIDYCKSYLKNPDSEYFEINEIDLDKIKKDTVKKKYEFLEIQVSTSKQEGDVAGSKLLKFYNHLTKEIDKYFEIKNKGFNYNEEKDAKIFYVVKKRNELLISGPDMKMEKNVKLFKKSHKKYFVKKGRVYSKEKINYNLKSFMKQWKNKNAGKMKDMSIVEMKIIK